MQRPRIVLAGLVAVLVGFSSAAAASDHAQPATQVRIVSLPGATQSSAQVATIAEHVVVARVQRQLGTRAAAAAPVSSFEVDVIANLKGRFGETVQVDQVGGRSPALNELVVVAGDRMLVEGDLVLLATRSVDGRQRVLTGAGNRLLEESTPWEMQQPVLAMRDALRSA